MSVGKRYLSGIALTLAVAAMATPSFAQHAEPHMNAARERAVHECSMEASKYTQGSWGSTQLTTFRACMNQRGQQE
jgi:hypothetical protein